VVWAVLETWHRDPFWSVISIACAVYCVYVLFWAYKPPLPPTPRPPDPDEDEESVEAEGADAEQPPVRNSETPES